MKVADMRQMKNEDLRAEFARLERHLFDLRAQAVTEKLADPTQLSKTRRDIARVLTVLRQRELEAAPESTAGPTRSSSVKSSGRRAARGAARATSK